MYHSLPSLVLGFHGCDRAVGEAVVRGPDRLEARPKSYDWLGHGIYFWENSPERALEWAREKQSRPASNPSGAARDRPFIFSAFLRVKPNVKLFANLHNLLDNEYVVARHPAGPRPGMPLTALAGVEISF